MLDYRLKNCQITHFKKYILLDITKKGSDTLKHCTSRVEAPSPLQILYFTSVFKALRISCNSNRRRQQILML